MNAWVAFGEGKREVGLTDEERWGLERCPNVELVTIRRSGRFALNGDPASVTGLILDALFGGLSPPLGSGSRQR